MPFIIQAQLAQQQREFDAKMREKEEQWRRERQQELRDFSREQQKDQQMFQTQNTMCLMDFQANLLKRLFDNDKSSH